MAFNEWKEYSFDELIDIIGGGTPKTTVEEYWNGHIPWLSVKDFNTDNRTVYETEKTITELGLQKSSTKLLNKGDLIISARGTVGALAQLGRQMAFNQSCYGLRANSKTTNDFLYYLLKYKLRSIQSNTHGSVFSTITKDTFKILKAIIPIDIEEQKAIAKILSDLDKKIETNNKINKKLEEMAQAIFKQWFIDFEFPNEDGTAYKSSGGEMVESKLGVIPKGWEGSNVLDNIEQVKNKNKEKLELPVLTVVKDGKFICSEDYFTKQVYSKDTSNYKIVEKYDVGYNPSRANIGSIAMLKEFNKGLLSPMYVVFRLNKKVMPFYFEYYMKRPGFIEKIALNSSGTTRQNFDYKAFRDFKIIIPPIEMQERAYKLIKNLQDNIKNRNSENSNLMKIRDTLLPKLMSGEIRVPLDNKDN